MTTTETVGNEFRVMAATTTGGQALVCLGETRRRAVAKARLFARHDRLPDAARWVWLEWWNGVRWVLVKTGRKELPVPRPVAR